MRLSGVVLLSGYGILLLVLGTAYGNPDDEEWLDPYDMLNYDASSKSMRKTTEASSYSNVPTKRREHSQDSSLATRCPDITECTNTLTRLQKEVEEHKRRVTFSSHQPTCNPVFKRFLSKLLKEINKLGLPNDENTDMHYDAEVKLSKQMVSEIQKLLNDEHSWRTGALDDALSQILINFKLHDHEAWKWRFEDTFSVELQTVLMVFLLVLIIVVIICTETWSLVSWFVQFKRMFAICFFISIVWNWFYLYKTAFAEHQANIVKMDGINEKCTGLKKIDWKDNFREWFRTTWTLQDDPCKQYYEVLVVNPILLVPPMKAITMTITTFITDPMKQLGQAISEFLRALLKDLPVTLQIPVLLTIIFAILVFICISTQTTIQQIALWPLRGGRRDPPPALQQPNARPLRAPDIEEERDPWAGGDAAHDPPPRHRALEAGNQVHQIGNRASEEYDRPEIRQRRPNRRREESRKVYVETLRNADNPYSGDETDLQGATAADSVQQLGEDEPLEDMKKEETKTPAPNSTEPKPSQSVPQEPSATCNSAENATPDVNQTHDVEVSAGVLDPSSREEHVETVGVPVQETMQ